jgi:SAM-dependent methyltransferase
MLKMYHRHQEPGSSAAYWEAFGGERPLAEHLRFCDVDPLRPLFTRVLAPGAVMLEGGCGRGQYVAYYAARGAKVIGLDFARDWLTAAHREYPSLMLCAGDVGALPFADHTFDVYYSGGVVEHFEEGSDRALAEARRVLKRDGVLLMSVPYLSPLRRMLAAVGRSEWRRVEAPGVDGAPDVHDFHHRDLRFYQYAYTIPEFTRLLQAAGFRVVETQGYAMVWGLYDIGPIDRAAAWVVRRRHSATASHASVASPSSNGSSRVPLAKRLIVSEDDTVPGAGWLVRAGRWLCANMMMYVCKSEV